MTLLLLTTSSFGLRLLNTLFSSNIFRLLLAEHALLLGLSSHMWFIAWRVIWRGLRYHCESRTEDSPCSSRPHSSCCWLCRGRSEPALVRRAWTWKKKLFFLQKSRRQWIESLCFLLKLYIAWNLTDSSLKQFSVCQLTIFHPRSPSTRMFYTRFR